MARAVLGILTGAFSETALVSRNLLRGLGSLNEPLSVGILSMRGDILRLPYFPQINGGLETTFAVFLFCYQKDRIAKMRSVILISKADLMGIVPGFLFTG